MLFDDVAIARHAGRDSRREFFRLRRDPMTALAKARMTASGGYCCKSLFVSPITNFPGRRRGDRILMWGTTSFCDELTGDFGGAFEATSIDGCRLFCRLAEI
jgi:hypothetical protein